MKPLKSYKVFFILLVLSGIILPASSRGTDYAMTIDTLIAGDTAVIRYDLEQYDPDKLRAGLCPVDIYYPEFCTVCKYDSIWSFKIESYQDTTYYFYFAVPLGTLPGRYYMFIDYEENPIPFGIEIYIYTPPYIFQQPQDIMVCEGDTAKFYVGAFGNNNWDLWYHWYHNNIEISSSSNGYFFTSYTQLQDTGRYYCIVTNNFGTDTSQTFRLELFPVPAHPGPPAGPDGFCPGTDTTEYSINTDPLATGYEWHLFPEDAGTIQQKDTSALIIWDPGFTGIAELYVELISGTCGATLSDSSDILHITVSGQSAPLEICIVGIDEETGKYRIVWERSGYESAQLFRIYRESNQADLYLEIGTVDPGESCVFIDPASVPDMLSHRYKISYIDSCGNESELSAFHQTMHLAANFGINSKVNLIWSEYMGIPFPAYDIYRGNHPDSMNVLLQVPSTVTAFTDDNPPYGIAYYQVGMSNPAGCSPAKKSASDYSSSRSNMEQVNVTGIGKTNENKLFAIYPNPAEKQLQIRLKDIFTGPIPYTVYNSLGAIVHEGMIRAKSTSIDMSALSPGLYILQISAGMKTYSARFVINSRDY